MSPDRICEKCGAVMDDEGEEFVQFGESWHVYRCPRPPRGCGYVEEARGEASSVWTPRPTPDLVTLAGARCSQCGFYAAPPTCEACGTHVEAVHVAYQPLPRTEDRYPPDDAIHIRRGALTLCGQDPTSLNWVEVVHASRADCWTCQQEVSP